MRKKRTIQIYYDHWFALPIKYHKIVHEPVNASQSVVVETSFVLRNILGNAIERFVKRIVKVV